MNYILSQIFICITYIFICITYLIKNRNGILLTNMLGSISLIASYALLDAWTGVGVSILAILRNLCFMIEDKYKKEQIHTKFDWCFLISFIAISIIIGIYTFNTIFSLFTIAAGIIYTISVWQFNKLVYRWLGVLTGIFGIVYYIFITSWFGAILETIMMISAVIGSLKMQLKKISIKENVNGIS